MMTQTQVLEGGDYCQVGPGETSYLPTLPGYLRWAQQRPYSVIETGYCVFGGKCGHFPICLMWVPLQ